MNNSSNNPIQQSNQNKQILLGKRIVLTGGGTAGHVMPNLALAPELRQLGATIYYIGSRGHEESLVKQAGIPFSCIATGKLRRYASLQNFFDIFKVIFGIIQSCLLMVRLRPHLVFSKGGFVAVPVCVAAKIFGIPIVTHESDYTPGLANRIIAKFANLLLYSFPETKKFLPPTASQLVLTPIRPEISAGVKAEGLKLCNFSDDAPTILIMGGSQGAQRINDLITASFEELTNNFQLIHLTGKGKSTPLKHPRYKQFEFVGAELPHLFACTDLAVCRAGANSLFELLSLSIPMLLIPLEIGSRGDQILNAKSFTANGWADMLMESKTTKQDLLLKINDMMSRKANIQSQQKSGYQALTSQRVTDCIVSQLK